MRTADGQQPVRLWRVTLMDGTTEIVSAPEFQMTRRALEFYRMGDHEGDDGIIKVFAPGVWKTVEPTTDTHADVVARVIQAALIRADLARSDERRRDVVQGIR